MRTKEVDDDLAEENTMLVDCYYSHLPILYVWQSLKSLLICMCFYEKLQIVSRL